MPGITTKFTNIMRNIFVYEFRVRFKYKLRSFQCVRNMTLVSSWPHPTQNAFFLFHRVPFFFPFTLFILFYVRLFWKTFVSCFCLLNKSWAHSLFSRSYHFLQVHPWTYRVLPPCELRASLRLFFPHFSLLLLVPTHRNLSHSSSTFFSFFIQLFPIEMSHAGQGRAKIGPTIPDCSSPVKLARILNQASSLDEPQRTPDDSSFHPHSLPFAFCSHPCQMNGS